MSALCSEKAWKKGTVDQCADVTNITVFTHALQSRNFQDMFQRDIYSTSRGIYSEEITGEAGQISSQDCLKLL